MKKIKCKSCGATNNSKRDTCWICAKSLKDLKEKDEINKKTEHFDDIVKSSVIHSAKECSSRDELIDFYLRNSFTIGRVAWDEEELEFHDEKLFGLYIEDEDLDDFDFDSLEFKYVDKIIRMELERIGYTEKEVDFFKPYIKEILNEEYFNIESIEKDIYNKYNEKKEKLIKENPKMSEDEEIEKINKLYHTEYQSKVYDMNKIILDEILELIIDNKDLIIKNHNKSVRNRIIKEIISNPNFLVGTLIYIIVCISFWKDYGIKTIFLTPIFMFVLFIIGCIGESFRGDLFGDRAKNMTPFEVSKELKEYELLNKLNNKINRKE